jgi:hypothetical protein
MLWTRGAQARGCTCEQELATPAACVAARAAAARRGEAGTSQREGRERRRGCWDGTWHNLERRWGGGCTAHGQRGWRGRRREETEEPGLEEDDED